MLNRVSRRINVPFLRCLYVPARTKRGSNIKTVTRDNEDKELDEKLRSVRQMEQKLRDYIKKQQEAQAQAEIASRENLRLQGPASEDDIAAIESGLLNLNKPAKPDRMGIFDSGVPHSITERLGSSAVVLLDHDWDAYLSELAQTGGLGGLPARDVETFISMIDFKSLKGARFTPTIEKMMADADLSTPRLVHNLMSGYATLGNPDKVETLAKQVRQTEIVYGHLAKAYFKSHDSTQVPMVINRMHAAGLQPTKPIYTMAIQSLVQSNRIKEAFTLFDNLKYLSTGSQPDTKMYNTMILAASKLHNVNKALDLYLEMTTRPINPLKPDNETLNHLIYACSRDAQTHTKAWDFFLEQRENALLGADAMRALVYLCGSTGELNLARKLIGQMCCNPATYPDDFMINSLFSAYLNYDKSRVSALNSKMGARVRSQLLENIPVSNADFMPPFLPVDELSDELIVAEAKAMLQFFSEKSLALLRVNNRASASSFGAPIIYNFLKLVIKRGSLDEFSSAWSEFTKRDERVGPLVESPSDNPYPTPNAIAISRNQDTYRLAIKAAAKFRDLDFGNTVWTERGHWRKSEAFRSLPVETRNKLDIGFAREMIVLFCECGDTASALKIVESSRKMFRWRRAHLEPLLNAAGAQEDFDTINAVKGLLTRYWEKETSLADINGRNIPRQY